MIKIDYKIEQVKPKVFAVIIEDRYDRATQIHYLEVIYISVLPNI